MAVTPQEAVQHLDWPEQEREEDARAAVAHIEQHIDSQITTGRASTATSNGRTVVDVDLSSMVEALRSELGTEDRWTPYLWTLVESALEVRFEAAGWSAVAIDFREERAILQYPPVDVLPAE